MAVTLANVRKLHESIKENVARVDRELANYRVAESSLYDMDKQPIFNPKHHETKISEVTAPLKHAVEEAKAAIEVFNQVVDDLLVELRTADPLDNLSPEQLVAAAAWRGFIQDDLAATDRFGMPVNHDRIHDRLQAVLNGQDAARKAVYVREVRRWADSQTASDVQSPGLNRIKNLLASSGDGSKAAAELADMRKTVARWSNGPVSAAATAYGMRRYVDPVTRQIAQPATQAGD